jgi:glucose-1-phosphate adenylyltransferase
MSRAMPDGSTMAQLARQTVAIVLAGGRGARLGPLTEARAKPAVPFGGKFRIIDFSLSNCLNSGIRRICIATQYQSQALFALRAAGRSSTGASTSSSALPAQQNHQRRLVQGHRRCGLPERELIRRHERLVLVLAGDHIYKMDYTRMPTSTSSARADMRWAGCRGAVR